MKPRSSSRPPWLKGDVFPAVFLFTIPALRTLTVSSSSLYTTWSALPGGLVVTQLTGLLAGLPKPDLIRPSCLRLYSFLSMVIKAFSLFLLPSRLALFSMSCRCSVLRNGASLRSLSTAGFPMDCTRTNN